MPSESPFVRALPACCLVAVLAGCAANAPAPAPAPPASAEPMRVMVLPAAPASAPASPPAAIATGAAPASAAPAVAPGSVHPLETVVAYAERLRTLPAGELSQEVQRLGETSYAPLRATQLALALAQSRSPSNVARAQSLLQRVLADASEGARVLHPFARLVSAQLTEQRRAEEQAERQAQQLKEAQRRIEQLNDRLEAVRAIERSLSGPPRPGKNRP